MEERTWRINLDGTTHTVTLSPSSGIIGAPDRFLVDGSTVRLEGSIVPAARHAAAFEVGGHAATMTRTMRRPSVASMLRRALSWRTLLGAAAGEALGPGGAAAGASAASASRQTNQWVFEVRVDGASIGAWVSTVVGTQASWRFVPDPSKVAGP